MANRYTGSKCIVCSQPFSEGDDIVVCPDCGTPYHRDCWKKEGKCINTELHERGFSWQPEPEQPQAEQVGEQRCMRCGAQLEEGQLFCPECGMPLQQDNGAERPFNSAYKGEGDHFANSQNGGTNSFTNYGPMNGGQDPRFGAPPPNGYGAGMTVRQIKLTEDSDIDGVKLGDLVEYIGRTSMSILGNCIKFAKTGMKTSLNLGALFFPEYYFFYRKMTLRGVFFMILSFLLSIPQLIFIGQSGSMGMVLFNTGIDLKSDIFVNIMSVCSFLNYALGFAAGLYANYWYYTRARSDILAIRADQTLDEDEIKQKIRNAGGTSWARVIIAGTALVIATLAFWLTMSALGY